MCRIGLALESSFVVVVVSVFVFVLILVLVLFPFDTIASHIEQANGSFISESRAREDLSCSTKFAITT